MCSNEERVAFTPQPKGRGFSATRLMTTQHDLEKRVRTLERRERRCRMILIAVPLIIIIEALLCNIIFWLGSSQIPKPTSLPGLLALGMIAAAAAILYGWIWLNSRRYAKTKAKTKK